MEPPDILYMQIEIEVGSTWSWQARDVVRMYHAIFAFISWKSESFSEKSDLFMKRILI